MVLHPISQVTGVPALLPRIQGLPTRRFQTWAGILTLSDGNLVAELHGAYSRVGKTESAYCHRDLQYDLIILSGWTDPVDNERNIAWTRELFSIWEPHSARAAYVNDLGDAGEDRARNAHGDNYARLTALKAKYDPTNFFRLNQNIKALV
jgi:Berberine and berberine like